MNKRWVIPVVVAIVLAGVLIAAVIALTQPQRIIVLTPTPLPTSTPSPAPSPTTTPSPTPTPAPTSTPGALDLIIITSPSPNQLINSPLTISGRARGSWYFEAQAPVQLLDGNGQTIALGNITAQGDWQTNNFVPFAGALNFTAPATNTGQLILQNANPSGLPEQSIQVIIPVRFR